MDNNLIPLIEYAKLKGKNPSNALQMVRRGSLKTAVKIGRQWFIDKDEPWTDHRCKSAKSEEK